MAQEVPPDMDCNGGAVDGTEESHGKKHAKYDDEFYSMLEGPKVREYRLYSRSSFLAGVWPINSSIVVKYFRAADRTKASTVLCNRGC